MNCPICGVGITFLGDWDNAMQYRCDKCHYEIAMTQVKNTGKGKMYCPECNNELKNTAYNQYRCEDCKLYVNVERDIDYICSE